MKALLGSLTVQVLNRSKKHPRLMEIVKVCSNLLKRGKATNSLLPMFPLYRDKFLFWLMQTTLRR